MKIKRLFNYKVLLGLIVLVGLWLRVVNLRSWFHFMMDEETIAWKVKPFLTSGKPFLIGGGTPFGFHLGPFFYYLSSIPLYFSKLDPIGWGMVAAVFGMMTITAIWLVGKELFSPRIGLIAALLWATSVTPILLDRHWWPLVLDPLFTLLVVFSLAKVLKGRRRWWIAVGLTLAAAWQADLSTLVLFVAALFVAALRIKSDAKYILFSLIILMLSVLPLVIFEIRHPGANLGKVLEFKYGGEIQICSISRLDECAVNVGESLWFVVKTLGKAVIAWPASASNLEHFYSWCKTWASQRLEKSSAIPGVVILSLLLVVAKTNLLLAIILASGILGIVMFHLLGGDLYDFYLAPLVPLALLAVAWGISKIWLKYHSAAAIAVAGLVIGVNIMALRNLYHPQGLELKQAAVIWVANQVGDNDFALESISSCSRFNGVRYLFMFSGEEPAASYMDSSLSWLYDRPPATDLPQLLVVFTTPNDIPATQQTRYNQLVRYSLSSKQFGDLSVLIVNNESGIHKVNF